MGSVKHTGNLNQGCPVPSPDHLIATLLYQGYAVG